MRRTSRIGRFNTALAGCAAIAGLAWAGTKGFAIAVMAVPLIMALGWWMASRLSLRGLVLSVGCTGALLVMLLPPVAGKFFGAAFGCGLFLPLFARRRPGEAEWFYLVPLMLLGALLILTGIDTLVRREAAWADYPAVIGKAVSRAQQFDQHALLDPETDKPRLLRADDLARWAEGQRLLGWRMTGVCGGVVLALAIYSLLGFVRRGSEAMYAPGEGFVRFQTGEGQLVLLLAGIVALIVLHYQPRPIWGYLGYGLIFFAGTGLFLQTLAVIAWYVWRLGVGWPVMLAGIPLIALIVAAPILAAPLAMVGLADVWLDFRRLDAR